MRSIDDVFGFDVDLAAEREQVASEVAAAGVLINDRLVDPRVACQIYDAHIAGADDHSCLGCNLQVSVAELGDFLAIPTTEANAITHLHLALHLINTLWERISDVCQTIELPKGQWSEGDQNFPNFKLARAWTNFLKHPGFFGMGIHHPIYVAGGGTTAATASHADDIRARSAPPEWVLIDASFVRLHWRTDQTGQSARKALAGPFTACVLLPDMVALAEGIADEFEGFVEQMTEPTWVRIAGEFAVYTAPCTWW